MTARRDKLGEICFAAEGMAGSAAASALRRLRSLADQAPSGRMFQAIATLTEMSKRSEALLVAGDKAMAQKDDEAAMRQLARAVATLDAIAARAEGEAEIPNLLPDYLKSRR
ncbi:MAG: hypothetical protein HY245_01620 [Rhizobiales bacterium]|nr:hypothetical protein [Hyphomicrobiales bacterium]MBI3672127.1 hypothetical protein [Hyphomicrobiales bacterium]